MSLFGRVYRTFTFGESHAKGNRPITKVLAASSMDFPAVSKSILTTFKTNSTEENPVNPASPLPENNKTSSNASRASKIMSLSVFLSLFRMSAHVFGQKLKYQESRLRSVQQHSTSRPCWFYLHEKVRNYSIFWWRSLISSINHW